MIHSRYRDLVCTLVARELKVRYRRSTIGFLWTIATTISEVLNFLLAMVSPFVILLVTGHPLRPTLLFLPVAILISAPDGTARVLEEASTTVDNSRILLQLTNNGSVRHDMTDSNTSVTWSTRNLAAGYTIQRTGDADTEFQLADDGLTWPA